MSLIGNRKQNYGKLQWRGYASSYGKNPNLWKAAKKRYCTDI
jgi:hypothetical protein